MTDLYLNTDQPGNALEVARQATQIPVRDADRDLRARIVCQIARALAELKRFDEAVPYDLRGLNEFLDVGDYDMAVRALASLGYEAVPAGRPEISEWALSIALRLSRLAAPSRELDIGFDDAPNASRVVIVNAQRSIVWTGVAAHRANDTSIRVQTALPEGAYFAQVYSIDGHATHEYEFRIAR
jgi:hypothetical protein